MPAGTPLHFKLPDEPIVLLADVTRIAQVISNLLNNSARYSDKRGHIHVEVRRELHGGRGHRGRRGDRHSCVDDRAYLRHVRSGSRTNGGAADLASALALSKQIVEMHGGRISVSSGGPGLGSTFEMRLPIASDLEASIRAIGVKDDLPTSRLRMLVVDDNRDSVESLSTLLRLMGNDVHVAFDGVEAVHSARTYLPDVILLDVGLPLRNGYEAARLIRGEPWGRNMVLIALTGLGPGAGPEGVTRSGVRPSPGEAG